MAMTLVGAPAVEPVTRDEFKAFARVDHTDDDDLIDALLILAREQVENITHRALITQTWDWSLDGFPAWFEVPRAPLQSITSISYIDTAGATQVLSGSAYRVDAVSQPGRITPAWGEVWPSTRAVTNAVTVRLVAGYGDAGSDVPESLKTAYKLVTAHLYEHREPYLIGAEARPLPFGLRALLGQYLVPVGF